VVIYLDTSALLKLVWVEDQSDALRAFLEGTGHEPMVSSRILTIEIRRAVRRSAPDLMPRADLLVTQVGQLGLSHAVVESASRLPDPTLRSLDAIHVATALVLAEEVSAFVTYDKRLFATAQALRLPAVAPS
jgi:uncharacterized protein